MGTLDTVRLAAAPAVTRALDMNKPGTYVHWGVVQISVANLIVIGLMLAVFVAALFVPFPGGRRRR